MTFDELNKLDLKTIADWPLGAKLIFLVIGFVVLVVAGWWFFWTPGLEQLEAGQYKEQELRTTFIIKKRQAINLEAYKKQLEDIKQAFGALLMQLPNKQEMDALITDINQAGLGRGLQFELFKPEAETVKEFYAELPIRIKVMGGYHDIAAFTSDVAKLSRIVTLHDIGIEPNKEGVLVMDTVAKTYRYLDEEEINAAQEKNKQGSG